MLECLDKLMFETIKRDLSQLVTSMYFVKPVSKEELLQSIEQMTIEAAASRGRNLTPMGIEPIPKRPHRKKRIRKKWMKKYGVNYRFNYSEQIPIESVEFTIELAPEFIKPEPDLDYKPHFGAYSSCLVDTAPLRANICTGE